MFQQESVPVKATTSTLKEDTPTEEVVVTESVVKQKDKTATSEDDLREQLRELEVERVEETDKEFGRGAYSGDICYPEPEYLLREKIYLPREETHQAKKRQWRKTWKKRFQQLAKVINHTSTLHLELLSLLMGFTCYLMILQRRISILQTKPEEVLTESQEPNKE